MVGPSNLSDDTNTPSFLLPFLVGDSVYLKCGSCKMTVEHVDERYCRCVWQHYESKIIMREYFIHAVLRKHV